MHDSATSQGGTSCERERPAHALSAHFRTLFEQSPIPICHEDFSAVRARFDELRAHGVTELEHWFAEHPDEVRDLASRVRLVAASRATLPFFGVERLDQVHGPLPAYYEGDALVAFARELAALYRGETRFATLLPVVTPGQPRRCIELRVTVAPGHEASLDCVLVGFLDVTALVHAERRLRASEQELRIVMDGVPALLGYIDRDETYRRVNRLYAEMLGVRVEDIAGARMQDVLTPDAYARAREPLARALAGETQRFENRITSADGVRIVEVTFTPDVREDGVVQGCVTLALDVTERKRIERSRDLLAETGALLAGSRSPRDMLQALTSLLVARAATYACIDLDTDGTASLDTPIVAHRSPLTCDLVLAMRQLYPPGPEHPAVRVRTTGQPLLVPKLEPELAKMTQSREHAEIVRSVVGRSLVVVPLEARGRTFGTLLLTDEDAEYDAADLTTFGEVARRAAAAFDNVVLFERAREAVETAEVANRAKDEFLAVVSHELRTPLNAMLGWARLLRNGSLTEEKKARAVDIIERNALAQAQLVDDLLDVSRIVSGKLRLELDRVDPALAVQAAADVVQPTADAKGVRLTVMAPVGVHAVLGDVDRLQQCVWNLLANAVRHTGTGGHVHVELRGEGGDVVIEVCDDGEGISSAFLPHAFDRFRQAETGAARKHGGLGVGLSIVRHLVQSHGGTVEAASEGPGRGARFTIRLPRAVSAPPGRSRTSAPPSPPSEDVPPATAATALLDGVSVLVVDDEEDARELVGAALAAWGAQVRLAPSVAAALSLLRDRAPDVLVSDIGMPGEDGYALVRKVRELPEAEGGRVPAIALTAYTRTEDRARALVAGFTVHVAKPVDPADLAHLVARLAGRTDS